MDIAEVARNKLIEVIGNACDKGSTISSVSTAHLQTAVAEMEYRVPENVIIIFAPSGEVLAYACPKCHTAIQPPKTRYCPICGKAMLWEDI